MVDITGANGSQAVIIPAKKTGGIQAERNSSAAGDSKEATQKTVISDIVTLSNEAKEKLSNPSNDTNPVPLKFGGQDLRKFDFTGLDLRGASFVGANLEGVDLSSLDLTGADFSNANIEHANLKGANLTGANLSNVKASHANLEAAIFNETTTFDNADFSFASLKEAQFKSVYFYSDDYKMGEAAEENYKNINFNNADLSGAVFEGAALQFRNSNFENANLDGVDFKNSISTGFTDSNLKGANLSNLTFASDTLSHGKLLFLRSDLKDINFANTSLTDTTFSGSDIRGLDLSNRDLTNVGFGASWGSDGKIEHDLLTDGLNLSGSILDGATFNNVDMSNALIDMIKSAINIRVNETNFSGANFSGTDFTGGQFDISAAYTKGTIFTNANFTNALIGGNAYLRGDGRDDAPITADFTGANFFNARFYHINFNGNETVKLGQINYAASSSFKGVDVSDLSISNNYRHVENTY